VINSDVEERLNRVGGQSREGPENNCSSGERVTWIQWERTRRIRTLVKCLVVESRTLLCFSRRRNRLNNVGAVANGARETFVLDVFEFRAENDYDC